jgi:hypothetical protein
MGGPHESRREALRRHQYPATRDSMVHVERNVVREESKKGKKLVKRNKSAKPATAMGKMPYPVYTLFTPKRP